MTLVYDFIMQFFETFISFLLFWFIVEAERQATTSSPLMNTSEQGGGAHWKK